MPARRTPWAVQPQGLPRIDRSSSANQRITSFFPLNGSTRELVSGRELTLSTGGTFGVDSRLFSLRGNGSSAGASIALDLSAFSTLTISFWLYWDTFANDDDLAMELTSNAVNNMGGFCFDPNESSTGRFQIFGSTSGGVSARSFARPTGAAWHHYVAHLTTSQANLVTAVWVDGKLQTLFADASAPGGGTFANSTLYLFSRNNASLFGAGRLQNLVFRGGYHMPEAEVIEEFNRPWQLFTPTLLHYATGPIIPVLSSATVIDITTTSVRPRVTVTF